MGGAKTGALSADSDLEIVIAAWPSLSEPIRLAIFALLKSAVLMEISRSIFG
jgi:hypothetical protein